MRVALVGLGSIGRRHLANLRALAPQAEIVVVRHARNDEGVPEGADRVVFSLEEALASKPDLALICGPTTTHVEAGLACLRSGAHLFVEKPLAIDVAGASALVAAASSAKRALLVGYNLRFLPSLRRLREELLGGSIGRPMTLRAEVGQYLPDWRPGRDYRETNSARADFGGSVEFELSHEIDYVRWLLGEAASVDATLARTSDLEIDVDDTAELLLRFRNGAIASVHMDMAQHSATRTCRVAGVNGTLTWDGISGEVRRYVPNEGWTVLHGGDGDRNDMYVAEMSHVLACVRGEAEPQVDGIDGLRTVEIVHAARRASDEGRRIEV
jgi:predicted dehydrogenase